MNSLLKFTLIMMVIYILTQVFFIKKGNSQGKYLSDMLHVFNDEEQFFTTAAEALQNEKNPEVLEKIKLLKAWGEAFYKRFDDYKETIHSVNVECLVTDGKRSKVKLNEDALFYLHLIIPNHLYGEKRMDLVEDIYAISSKYEKETKDMLTYQIGMANLKFYKNEGDMGQQLFEEILEGDYGQYTYSKDLIGVYKSMVTATLAAIYRKKGQTEKYYGLKNDLEFFANMPLGIRWIEEVGIPVPKTALTEEIAEAKKKEEEEKNSPESDAEKNKE